MAAPGSSSPPVLRGERVHPYVSWIESLDVPIYRGYYLEDLRTIEVGGPWHQRGANVAFLELAGQEGISGVYVLEIPPGETLPPFRIAIDDLVYVLKGRGLTTIWAGERPRKTFEWGKHALFLIPANHTYQLSNLSGTEPVRLLFTNGLPTAMAAIPEPAFYFSSPVVDLSLLYGDDPRTGPEGGGASEAAALRLTAGPAPGFYSEAKIARDATRGTTRNVWVGNFFPNMLIWDQLDPFRARGAGGRVVWIHFPKSIHGSHMSVFPAGTYKKAHRHGPGVVIVIPAGEGYSVMWPHQGAEKIVCPWHEGSVFVPPNRWWHQHFNAGPVDARYVALHAPSGMPTGAASFTSGSGERITNREEDQIEYPDEDPWIRQYFEVQLAKHGARSAMPEEAYRDRDYQWKYAEDGVSTARSF